MAVLVGGQEMTGLRTRLPLLQRERAERAGRKTIERLNLTLGR
jgi:hypothetical protein